MGIPHIQVNNFYKREQYNPECTIIGHPLLSDCALLLDYLSIYLLLVFRFLKGELMDFILKHNPSS